VLVYSGCAEPNAEGGPTVESRAAEEVAEAQPEPSAPSPATPKPAVAETKPVEAAPKHAPAKTADAAIAAMIAGLESNQLELVWDALPPSYQNDVDNIVQEFAGKMDAELWKKMFGVAKRISNLLGSKKELVLANQYIVQATLLVEIEQLSLFWDEVEKFLQTIVNSEISDLEKLKKFNGRDFAAGTVSSLVDQVFAVSKIAPGEPLSSAFKQKLSETKLTLVEENGDLAKVKIEVLDADPIEMEMVRVEGHWIPKDLPEAWAEQLRIVKAQLATLTPELIESQKTLMMVQLDAVNQILEQIEATKNPEDLNSEEILNVVLLMPFLQIRIAGILSEDEPDDVSSIFSEDDPDKIVTISVLGKLDKKTTETISDTLLESVSHKGKIVDAASFEKYRDVDTKTILTIIDSPGGKVTKFELSPVKDVAAYAKEIKFGKVTKIDVENRTITVELGASDKDKTDLPKKETAEKKR
jgi:hypothetical protein